MQAGQAVLAGQKLADGLVRYAEQNADVTLRQAL
jgi:hypothetical protein